MVYVRKSVFLVEKIFFLTFVNPTSEVKMEIFNNLDKSSGNQFPLTTTLQMIFHQFALVSMESVLISKLDMFPFIFLLLHCRNQLCFGFGERHMASHGDVKSSGLMLPHMC